jgi:hypothetical protein
MSKKKNTLKDLDEFLKQQAATLVSPDKLSQKVEEEPVPVKTEQPTSISTAMSSEKILADLKMFAKHEGYDFQKKLYDLIIASLEEHDHPLPEDKMLINTALYLKSGEKWKDVIRDYWKKHG